MKKSGLFLSILLITAFLAGCANTPRLSLTIPTTGNASAITWTPDGSAVITNGFKQVGTPGSTGTVGVWNIEENKLSARLISAEDVRQYTSVNRISINSAGTYLLLATPYTPGSGNGFISLYDVLHNRLLFIYEGLHLDDNPSEPLESIQDASFSPDITRFVVAGSFYLRILDAAGLQEMARIPVNARDGTIKSGDEHLAVFTTWSSDSRKLAWLVLSKLAYYNLDDGSVTVIQGEHPAPNKSFSWSPDGSTIAYESNRSLVFISISDGNVSRNIAIKANYEENHVKSIQYSPNGKYVAFCTSEYLGVWDAGTGKLVLGLSLEKSDTEMNRFEDIAWSPDSQNLAVVSYGAKQILIYRFAH